MPRKFVKYLDSHNIYACKYCHSHIAAASDLTSTAVHPSDNTALVFNSAYHDPNLESTSAKAEPQIETC